MGSSEVVDPDGVRWSVRRRWYPWRRTLSLRDLWASNPVGKSAEGATGSEAPNGSDGTTGDAAEESTLPRNWLLKVLFIVAAAIVWVVYGTGKVLFYTVVVILFLVVSVLELALELVVMPITLLLRVFGVVSWPVEIGRAGEHVATRHGGDFAAAGDVRDGVLDDIRRGVLPVPTREPAPEPTREPAPETVPEAASAPEPGPIPPNAAPRGGSKPDPVGSFED